MPSVSTHLMFQGDANPAIELYSKIFKDFNILSITKYGEEDPQSTGMVKLAKVDFAGQSIFIIDSPISHAFEFTPSVSLFVEFEEEEIFRAAFDALAEKGKILMPLDNYGFSEKFVWVTDRFGVSWQLSLGTVR
ncbi:MAG: VOC family protein [Albidovulum sp.]|nr:VOC family protein [Albidovulum sp.]MDE0532678.1 VOC family protein [Albidovulum sp.]